MVIGSFGNQTGLQNTFGGLDELKDWVETLLEMSVIEKFVQ